MPPYACTLRKILRALFLVVVLCFLFTIYYLIRNISRTHFTNQSSSLAREPYRLCESEEVQLPNMTGWRFDQVSDELGPPDHYIARYALQPNANPWNNDWFLSVTFDSNGLASDITEWGHRLNLPVAPFDYERFGHATQEERLRMLRSIAITNNRTGAKRLDCTSYESKSEHDLHCTTRAQLASMLGVPDYELLIFECDDGMANIHLQEGRVMLSNYDRD